jgi:hypothetical protein
MLCCTVVLATAGGSGLALAQSAGDEQYQDPFGDEPAQTQTATTPEPGSTLTRTPQTTSSTPALSPAPSAPAGTLQDAPQDGSGTALADTGIDAGLFFAIGIALLLLGVGLRLRTLPERF